MAQVALIAAFETSAPTARPNPANELSPASSEAVTIVAVSDVHARPGVLDEALACARETHAAAVLLGGDLANQNSEFEYRYAAALLATAPPVPVFLAIGNHEGFDRHANLSRERFTRFFGPPVSWFATRGVLVVSIDTSDEHSFPETQARAVDSILTAQRPRARHAVILTHVMPRFEKPAIDKRGFVKHLDPADSDRLRELCKKHDVDLVLGGHFHGYATEQRGRTSFVMSGGGGGALDGPGEFYHYLRLTFDDRGAVLEVVRVKDPFGAEWIHYLLLKYEWRVLSVLSAAAGACCLAFAAGWRSAPRWRPR
jgi:Icc-related predicted phosphoesterase